MKLLSRQKAFDCVWNHFIVNKAPLAKSSAGGCYYLLGSTGARCAIGIQPEWQELEANNPELVSCGSGIEVACEKFPEVREVFGENGRFFAGLQDLHDQADKCIEEDDARRFARDWSLEIPN